MQKICLHFYKKLFVLFYKIGDIEFSKRCSYIDANWLVLFKIYLNKSRLFSDMEKCLNIIIKWVKRI